MPHGFTVSLCDPNSWWTILWLRCRESGRRRPGFSIETMPQCLLHWRGVWDANQKGSPAYPYKIGAGQDHAPLGANSENIKKRKGFNQSSNVALGSLFVVVFLSLFDHSSAQSKQKFSMLGHFKATLCKGGCEPIMPKSRLPPFSFIYPPLA